MKQVFLSQCSKLTSAVPQTVICTCTVALCGWHAARQGQSRYSRLANSSELMQQSDSTSRLTASVSAVCGLSRRIRKPQPVQHSHVACTLCCAVPAGHLPACLPRCAAPGGAEVECCACADQPAVGAAHTEAGARHGVALQCTNTQQHVLNVDDSFTTVLLLKQGCQYMEQAH